MKIHLVAARAGTPQKFRIEREDKPIPNAVGYAATIAEAEAFVDGWESARETFGRELSEGLDRMAAIVAKP